METKSEKGTPEQTASHWARGNGTEFGAVCSCNLIIIIIFGSFPAIRAVTGRRPRRFSLFMNVLR